MEDVRSPTPTPGQAVADIARGGPNYFKFEILKSDGTPIGTIITSGLAGGSAPPGAPLSVTQGNDAIIGGTGFVPRPRRLAMMNLYLHGIEPHIYLGDTIYEPDRGERYDIILTNPPFGTKGANQAPEREGFTIETSNKQLNFVQHVVNILKRPACCSVASNEPSKRKRSPTALAASDQRLILTSITR
jgi:hypothetical protein